MSIKHTHWWKQIFSFLTLQKAILSILIYHFITHSTSMVLYIFTSKLKTIHLLIIFSLSSPSLQPIATHQRHQPLQTNPPPLPQPLAIINHYKLIHHHNPSNYQQNPFINQLQNQNPFIKIKIKPIN